MAYGYSAARRSYRPRGGYRRRASSTTRNSAAKKIQRTYKRRAARKVFARRVNAVVTKKLEKKTRFVPWCNQQLIWGNGLSTVGIATQNGHLIPNLFDFTISQDVTDAGRVGNEVLTRSCTLRGFIRSEQHNNATNNSTMPFEVHMILYRKKNDILNADPSTIKQGLANNSVAIDGTAINSLYPWNRDLYTIYTHKVWKMRALPVASTVVTTQTQDAVVFNPGTGACDNPAFRRFSVKCPCPKKLKFTDGVYKPVNAHLACGFWVVDGSGQQLATSQKRASVYMDLVYTYSDA